MSDIRLVLVILRRECYQRTHDHLLDAGFRVTEFSSTGGFLRQSNTTLLIGVPSAQVELALKIVREQCASPTNAEQHSATIFVLKAAEMLHI